MTLSVCLFVCGNIHANYYEVYLNYGYHRVSRSAMTGMATLPSHQRNSLVHKAPRTRANTRTPANQRGRRGRSGEGARSKENEGDGFWRRREVRIDDRRQIGEPIAASAGVGGKEWRGRGGSPGGFPPPPWAK